MFVSNVSTVSKANCCRPIVKRSVAVRDRHVFEKPWVDLAENEHAAVQRLGYDAVAWDVMVGAEPDVRWELLRPEQREAAAELGYSQTGAMGRRCAA